MEIEWYHIHEHPLTLCEIEGLNEPPCPVCCIPSSFDGYNCSYCKFRPEKCSFCNDKPSGSFYFCKDCWPKSPFFHIPCVEFPQKIQIALRPYCPFRFVKDHDIDESSSSDMFSFPSNKEFDCDFCNESRKGHKFRCDLCNFQICFGCADILIKYHQHREHIEHSSHHHPLILLENTSNSSNAKDCKMCLEKIHGQSYYCCAPCKFYIHKSCGELLEEVKHPFHPRHYLTLQMSGPWWGYHCRACGLKFDKRLCYRCDDCKFEMHPECLSLKPTIKYQGHQHDLLTLLEDMAYKSECRACGHDIKNTFYVRCVPCRLDFHVHCGPAAASLPPTVVHKNHNQPLSLVKDDSTLLECDDCEEEIDPNHPFYSCLECYPYNAHVRCVITEIQSDERERQEHFTHHHLLALLESSRNEDRVCYICKKLIIQWHTAYGCDPCTFYLHKSCFKLPKVMCHKSHDSHYLTLEDSSNSGNVVSGVALGIGEQGSRLRSHILRESYFLTISLIIL